MANLVADCDEQEASRAERIALLQSRDSSTDPATSRDRCFAWKAESDGPAAGFHRLAALARSVEAEEPSCTMSSASLTLPSIR